MLKVLKAMYGPKDVTELLAAAVTGDILVFPVSNATLGGDPTPGRGKRLVVEYDRDGHVGTESAGENRTLKIR